MQKSLYDILGISPGASRAEVKRAYRRLAREFHPDSVGSEAGTEKFQELSEAYSILASSERREEYDRANGFSSARPDPRSREEKINEYRAQQRGDSGRGTIKQNIFDSKRNWNIGGRPEGFAGPGSARFKRPQAEQKRFGDQAKEFFKSLFGSQPKQARPAGRSTSGSAEPRSKSSEEYYAAELTVDVFEAIAGTTKELSIPSSGGVRSVRVKIPSGIDDNSTLRINFPESGTLPHVAVRVRIRVTPHPLVGIKDGDIILTVPLTIGEAVNGCELNVPGLEGQIKVAVPPQIKALEQIKLEGKGVKNKKSGRTGDLVLKLVIMPPDTISLAGKEAARAIDDHYLQPVRKDLPKKFSKS